MMSWNSFSQSVTDSTKIQLTKPIARLVIKDLIQFDGLSREMETMQIILSETNYYLRSDGNWATPTDTTYSNFNNTVAGLVPASGGGTTKYLRADGTWVVPPDNDTGEDNVQADWTEQNGTSDAFIN